LRIKAFFGTSENAVKTQIWIAVSVYVLVAIVKKRLKLSASLYEILQILSLTLFERIPLDQLLAQIVTAEIQSTAEISCFCLNNVGTLLMPNTNEQRLDVIENCNILLNGVLKPFAQTDDTPEGRMITQLKWLKERAENNDLSLPVDPIKISSLRYIYTDGELLR